MGDYSKTWDRTAADDALDYAMGISLLATAATTILLITNGLPVATTLIGMSVIGGIWTFTILPHLVAHWLDVNVDDLLGIQHTEPIQIHTEETTDTTRDTKA